MQLQTDEMERKRIGGRVKDARKSVGLSQLELGAALRKPVTDQTISNIETGGRDLKPSVATEIEWICNADPGYLLTGEGYLHGGFPRLTSPGAHAAELEDLGLRVADLESQLAILWAAIAAGDLSSLAERLKERQPDPATD